MTIPGVEQTDLSLIDVELLEPQLCELRGAYEALEWPGTPNVEYTFFYSAHNTAQDIAGLGELITATDVFVPESFGWDSDGLRTWRQIAKGNAEALGAQLRGIGDVSDPIYELSKGATEERALALFKSKNRPTVILLDITRNHEAMPKLLDDYVSAIYTIVNMTSPEEVLQQINGILMHEATFHLKRELHMLAGLHVQANKLSRQRKQAKRSTDLNVLVQLGAMHVRVADFLEKHGEQTRVHFTQLPFPFSPRCEVIISHMLGWPVSDEQIAHAVFQAVIEPMSEELYPDVDPARVFDLYKHISVDIPKLSLDDFIAFMAINDSDEWAPFLRQRLFA